MAHLAQPGYASRSSSVPARCSLDGCPRPALARGLCGKHYQRWTKYGDPATSFIDREHAARCSAEACSRPYYARGKCKLHYEQAVYHAKRFPNQEPPRCWAADCETPGQLKTGLCPEHQRIADDWNGEAEEAMVTCCVKTCGEMIDARTFGWEFPCCPPHLMLITQAKELEEWGIGTDMVAYLEFPDWISAKWLAAILGKEKQNRQYLGRVSGDTPLFGVIITTCGDLYPLFPLLLPDGTA